MKPIEMIQPGESLDFVFDLGGDQIDDWTCTVSWKQYAEDIATDSRVVAGSNRQWKGFMTSTETSTLTGGLWYLVAILENSTTLEKIQRTKRFYVSQTWEGGFAPPGAEEIAMFYLTATIGGVAADEETILDNFYFDQSVTIKSISLYARQSPTGSAFTVDLLKEGLEQSKTASIADGLNEGTATVTGLTYTTGEKFGIIVKAVGSTFPGGEIDIKVHYEF